eukprot:gene7956-8813_t
MSELEPRHCFANSGCEIQTTIYRKALTNATRKRTSMQRNRRSNSLPTILENQKYQGKSDEISQRSHRRINITPIVIDSSSVDLKTCDWVNKLVWCVHHKPDIELAEKWSLKTRKCCICWALGSIIVNDQGLQRFSKLVIPDTTDDWVDDGLHFNHRDNQVQYCIGYFCSTRQCNDVYKESWEPTD